MINSNYIKLIERVKEKHPELRKLVEEIKPWCIEIPFGEEWCRLVIWQLDLYIDLYILSKALWDNYCIKDWAMFKITYICYEICFHYISDLPSWNIETYPDELLEQLYQLI